MAAVAGSKGRLVPSCKPRGPQIDLVMQLLGGHSSPAEVAQELVAARRLREVGVDTNMVCNLSCKYCYLRDRAEEPGSVPLDVLSGRLESLAASGTKLFAFIGKEPLADSRAIGLLRRLDEVRRSGAVFRTGMVTNGTLVERWLPELEETELSYIDVSIDGLDDEHNVLRGAGTTSRIMRGIEAVLGSRLRDRFATATVLTSISCPDYRKFVESMFSRGVITCFASPVLRFAMSNEVSKEALGVDSLWRLVDELSDLSATPQHQIIIDLPYKYSWFALQSGLIPARAIEEDAYEALYWRVGGSSVYIKLNPFPYSYWRALRITHDGRAILNMDLAAHPKYEIGSVPLSEVRPDIFSDQVRGGLAVLSDSIERLASRDLRELHERDLEGQHARDMMQRIAA